MFDRANITLGIGPHSSFSIVSPGLLVLLKAQTYLDFYSLGVLSAFNIQGILSTNALQFNLGVLLSCMSTCYYSMIVHLFTYILREF